MKRPCPVKIACEGIRGTPDPDWPVINFSSEAPDPLEYAGDLWPIWDPFAPPCIGAGCVVGPVQCDSGAQAAFNALGAILVESPESQEYANLLAAAALIGCSVPDPAGTTIFFNDRQCASITCPNGTTFTYCVPAGIKSSAPLSDALGTAWVDWANAWAASYAAERASALQICGGLEPRTTPIAPGGHAHGPGLAGNPGWICLGEELFDEDNTYHVTNSGSAQFTFAITDGQLAPGTTLVQTSPTTAVVKGTPTAAGVYSYTVTATSTSLPTLTVEATDTLFVLSITNADSLPAATVGNPYSEVLTATGGVGPYTFSVPAVSLPAWLTLDPDGTLSGTPDVGDAGSVSVFDVTVRDVSGRACAKSVSLSVTGVGYKICDYAALLEDLTVIGPPVGCSVSALPAWDGHFDHVTVWDAPPKPMYYFINQSVLGQSVAASDAPNYPAGDWQNLDSFASLYWDGANWQLIIDCVNSNPILVATGPGTSPTDPTGAYSVSIPVGHADVLVQAINTECPCPDWTTTAWPVPFVGTAGAGIGLFIPNNAPGDTFTAAAVAPGAGDSASVASQNGTIADYHGPGCNCNLHLTISGTSGSPTGTLNIIPVPPSVALLTVDLGALADGDYDYPFVLPDSGGTPYAIHVEVLLQAVSAGPFTAKQVDGKLANI